MASLKAALGASLAAARTLSPLLGCRPPPALCSTSAAAHGTAMEAAPRWLAGLRFDNRALRALPVETPPPDPEGAATVPRLVPGACFSRVRPAPLRQPRLVALSEPALALLGLGAPPADAAAREAREAEAALFFSGNALLPGAEPAAHCYCGHQFGQFAGQLGDGAAMYLGEVCTEAGERWELQLKGAGPTPFSRWAPLQVYAGDGHVPTARPPRWGELSLRKVRARDGGLVGGSVLAKGAAGGEVQAWKQALGRAPAPVGLSPAERLTPAPQPHAAPWPGPSPAEGTGSRCTSGASTRPWFPAR